MNRSETSSQVSQVPNDLELVIQGVHKGLEVITQFTASS